MLRKTHLISFAERARFYCSVAKSYRANRKFQKSHPGFKLPPVWVAYDAYSMCDWNQYYNSGMNSARFLADIIKKYVEICPGGLSVLEWGCGPGRIIRHLHPFFTNARIFGTDYNAETISWASSAIDRISFTVNQLAPPLPYAKESFDAIYCLSVFTHLSEAMHFAWFQELIRVTKPNGIVIFTTHGDRYKSKLLPSELKQYEEGRLVVRDKVLEGSRLFTAFQPPDFVRHHLAVSHGVLEHITSTPILIQDVWVIRKSDK